MKSEKHWNKKAKKLRKKVKKLLRKHVGPKCPDFEGLCLGCRKYESLEDLFKSPYE